MIFILFFSSLINRDLILIRDSLSDFQPFGLFMSFFGYQIGLYLSQDAYYKITQSPPSLQGYLFYCSRFFECPCFLFISWIKIVVLEPVADVDCGLFEFKHLSLHNLTNSKTISG